MRDRRMRNRMRSVEKMRRRNSAYHSNDYDQQIGVSNTGKRIAVFVVIVSIMALLCVAMMFALKVLHSEFSSKTIQSRQQSSTKIKINNDAKRVKNNDNSKNKAIVEDNRNVDTILAKMTLEDKVAQMFMVRPEDLSGFKGVVTASGSQTKQSFDALPVGGVMYSADNLQNSNQTKTMISGLQKISESRLSLPAFISVDEEGGTVARVSINKSMGVNKSPNMSDVGASGDVNNAKKIGKYMGSYLSNLGFNVDFAPVADVLTNPRNTLIKYRSFGSDPALVARMTSAFSNGLWDSHVFATYKHFPGHGSTFTDSHKGTTISQLTESELDKTDLVPFKDAVRNGVSFIMVSHVSYPKVTGDNTPASMSKKIMTDIAREKLGYKGILISDSLGMGAITNKYNSADAAITGIKAGLDMLLCPQDLHQAYNAVINAVKKGDISQSRIDQSVKRIISAKLRIANKN